MSELEFPSFSIDEKEKAIIVGVQLAKQTEDEINEDLDELSSLLMTLGVPVVYRLMQKDSSSILPSLLVVEKSRSFLNWLTPMKQTISYSTTL